MKLIRFLVIGVAVVVVLAVVVIALAFTPGVQTWAVRKAVAGQPGLDLTVDQVNAGLHVTRLDNLHLAQPGLKLTVPSVEIEVSLVEAASGRVTVKRLVAKGWTLDLDRPAATAVPGASSSVGPAAPAKSAPTTPPTSPGEAVRQAFDGIFQQLRLPVDVSVDGVDVAGDVILPAGQGAVHVVLDGGGLGSGREGKFNLHADFVPHDKSVVTTLTSAGVLLAKMDTSRTFGALSFTYELAGRGPKFPQGASLSFAATASRENKDEGYRVFLKAGAKELFNLQAKLPAGAPLAGTWTLDAHDTDLAPFMLGRALPVFAATGQGTFTADRTFAELHAVGRLTATVDKLSVLSPEFSAVGRVDFTTDFDVTRQGDVIRIDRFVSQLAGAKPVLGVETRQVLKFNPVTHVLEAARPADDLFGITLQGLPLAWARPFLPGFEITGDDVRGEFAASAFEGGFKLRPVAPVVLTGLNVSQAGKPLVRALDFKLTVGALYTPKVWQVSLDELSLVSGATTLFKLNAKVGREAGASQPVKAAGQFEADLPTALAQPGAPATVALEQGVARGDFTASLDDKQGFAVTLGLSDLVSAAHQRLPAVALYVRADRDASGRIEAQAPFVITQAGRKSDLTLGAVVTPGKNDVQIDAQLESAALYLEDLKLFAGLLPPALVVPAPSAANPAPPASAPAVKPATPAPASAPAGPLWTGVTGNLKLALKKVVYSSSFEITDIGGTVKITPDSVSLDALRAALGGDATFKAAGSMDYDAKQTASPYALKADLAVANFDPAPFLSENDPAKPAPVEGKFDLMTRLSGRAVDPAGFKDTALGDVSLISRGGTLRVLSVKSGKIVSGASTAATALGLFGALTGNRDASRIGQKSEAAAAVVQQLGTIKFDQLNIVLARDAARDVLIKDLTLISPQLRMAGSGKITFLPDVPLRRQPLKFNLQIGARDQLADNFRQLRLLATGGADALGYAPLSEPIQLDGTLQAIGTAQLQRLIYNAITN